MAEAQLEPSSEWLLYPLFVTYGLIPSPPSSPPPLPLPFLPSPPLPDLLHSAGSRRWVEAEGTLSQLEGDEEDNALANDL